MTTIRKKKDIPGKVDEVDLSELSKEGFEIEVNGIKSPNFTKPAKVTAKPKAAPKAKAEEKPPVDEDEPIDLSDLDQAAKEGKVRSSVYGLFPAVKSYDLTRLDGLRSVIEGFPVAEEVSLSIPARPEVGTERFKGVIVDGVLLDVPTSSYHLTQHAEAFAPIVEFLETRREFDKIAVASTYNRAKATVHAIFLDEKFTIEGPDGRELHFGLSMTNSYNRSTSIIVTGASYRDYCTNGAVHRALLGEKRVYHSSKDPIKSAGLVVDSLMSAISVAKDAMLLAGKIDISPADFAEIVELFEPNKKRYDVIVSVYDRAKDHSAYGAWVAATDAAVPYPSETERMKALTKWEDFVSVPENVVANIPAIKKELAEIRAARAVA